MTLNVTAGPGIAAYESTRYTASVNASPAWVVGQTNDMTVPSPHWTQGNPVELSWVKFNGNETATVSITRIAGAITSAVVYPKNVATQVIVGGILILTVPTNTRLHVEVNGDRANAILVFSQPVARAEPSGAVGWDDVGVKTVTVDSGTETLTCNSHGLANGQRVGYQTDGTYPTASGGDIAPHTHYYVVNQTANTFQLERSVGGGVIDLTSNGTGTQTVYITSWTNTSSPLAFPSGEWHFGRLFELADGVTIYLTPDAVCIGGFDLRGRNGVSIFGEGLLLGTFATHNFLFVTGGFTTFASQLPYCMFLGYDATSGQVHWDNEVQGVTISSLPFFCNFEGVSEWTNVQCINPWFYGTLTPQLSSNSEALPAGQMTYCYSYSGDDVLTLGEQVSGFYAVVQGCFLATANNSCLHFGYWSQPDSGTFCFVSQCDMMHLGIADVGATGTGSPSYGGNSVMKCWTDGYDGEESYGRFDVFVQDCRVWGKHASRLLTLLNKPYPYDYYGDEFRAQKGQSARFQFTNIAVEVAPAQVSAIEGLDWTNTPHNISFQEVEIEGVPLTAANFGDYFTVNTFPYAILVGGRSVVTSADICNQALAAIAAKSRVTSIAPPDTGSIEAEQCARYYNEAIETLLEMHEWSFATKRVALTEAGDTDTTSWLFRYVIPSDMCRLIAVLPEGVTSDHISAGVRAPAEAVRELDEDGVLRIYTNEENATLRYTAFITDPNAWSPLFRQALVALLASKIAGPLWRGQEGEAVKQRCLRDVEVYLARAKVSDASQQRLRPEPQIASYMQNRRGGRTAL